MLVYSTCRTCKGSLLLGPTPDVAFQKSPYWHDACDPKPTKMEKLCEAYRLAITSAEGENGPLAQGLARQIEMLGNQPPRLLDSAVLYASWGWPIFPLKPRSKEPNTPHGFKDASADIDRLKRWWAKHPNDNIGVATGHLFDVIDIDVPKHRKDGSVTVAGAIAYSQIHEKLPDCHGMACTEAGGMHLFIRPTGGGNRAAIEPGIDTRGVSGYVVLAPSILDPIPDKNYPGGQYSWTYVPSPVIKSG